MSNITTQTGADDVETLKQSIERRLAERAAQDPGFITELMLHPDGVIKPLITEALGDDGEVNLADVNTTVHLETGRSLHFVVAVPAGDVEAYGVDVAGALGSIGSLGSGDSTSLFGHKTKGRKCGGGSTVTTLCTLIDKGCPTVYGNTYGCPKF